MIHDSEWKVNGKRKDRNVVNMTDNDGSDQTLFFDISCQKQLVCAKSVV